MKKLFFLFSALALFSLGIMSCSNDDDDETNNNSSSGTTTTNAQTYSIAISDKITGGKVVASKSKAAADTIITLTVSANTGYDFGSITVTNLYTKSEVATIATTKGSLYTFTMPAGNVSVTATFVRTTPAVTKSAPNAVGDVVLSDGTAIAFENVDDMTDAQKAKTVAVIFYVGESTDFLGEKMLGIGVKDSQTESVKGYAWRVWSGSSTDSLYKWTIPTSLACTPSGATSGSSLFKTESTTFTGNTDGSTNWSAICSSDSTASANAETRFPAFNWANTYGTRNELSGKLASGWYLPTSAELFAIAKNYSTAGVAFYKVTGNTFKEYWTSSIWYYSSSGNYSGPEYVRIYDDSASISNAGTNGTDYKYYVCAIREF